MGTEKVQAFQESMSAMGLQLWRSNVELALRATRQWWSFWQSACRWQPFWLVPTQRTLGRSAAAVIDKGLAPAHRRVNRNLRRLCRPAKR
jgi:hypothetical protein